jgi:hypothetical protein
MYVSATSPDIYEPVTYADEVVKTVFYTLWNPNLHNTEKLILKEFKKLNPIMCDAIEDFYNNAQQLFSKIY